MSTLRHQMTLLRSELDLAKQAGNAKHAIKEYQAIFERLDLPRKNLDNFFAQYTVIRTLPDDAPRKMEFSPASREREKLASISLKKFSDRWKAEKHNARQGDDLDNATISMDAFIEIVDGELSTCWKEWVLQLAVRVDLEDALLESQKNIPGLEDTYANFVNRRKDFRSLSSTIPRDPSTIGKLQQICADMVSLIDDMKFDLPDEVSVFFKALNSSFGGKVPLSLLTAEVLAWLGKQDLLGKFTVERVGKRYL